MSRFGFEPRVLRRLAPIAGLLALACGREPERTGGGPVQVERARLLSDGLVAAYAFEEGSGTDVHDATAGDHDTTLDGQSWAIGRFGTALAFDVNKLTIADSAPFDLGTGMSLSAWVLPSDDGWDWNTVLMKEGEEDAAYALFTTPEHAPVAYLGGAEWAELLASVALPVRRWTFLAATYDQTELKLYVNAALADTLPFEQPLMATNGPLSIGGNNVWGDYFDGRIDEVRIHDRALSASEIAQAMATPVIPGTEPDATPPSVTLTAPAGAITASGVVALAAVASDNDGVASVQFLLDGEPITVSTVAPYERSWLANASPAGSHELRAQATDFVGNTALSAAVTVTVPAEISRPGLVAAWGFDEGAGEQAFDASGAAHDAELTGQTWVQGKFGHALQFGADQLTVASSEFIELTDRMTLSAWVLPDVELEGNELVLEKYADWQAAYRLSPGSWLGASTGFRGSDFDWYSAYEQGVEAEPGAWTHVAGTYDGTTLKLFLNGEMVAESEAGGSMRQGSAELVIGGNGNLDSFFPGRLDEIRIYNRALSQAEIVADMATPITPGATVDTTPPNVSVTEPAESSSAAGLVALSASASDASGIASVRFFVDGVAIGVPVTEPPYTQHWHASSALPGTHAIHAEATDRVGNQQASLPVEVFVDAANTIPGLVLAFGFDEGTGDEIHDGSGAGHDTLLSGQTWATGRFGSALEFSGELLEVPESELLDMTDAMTLSAWVMPWRGTPYGYETVLSKDEYGDLAYLLFSGNELNGPEVRIAGQDYDEFALPLDGRTRVAEWSHLAFTYESGELKLYVNGELEATETFEYGPLLNVDGPLSIGGNTRWWDHMFIGRIDEVRLYDRALSASELQADMLAPVTPGASVETTPPFVELVAPADGATVSGLVTLQADASDANGVQQVEYLLDGVSLATALDQPYERIWHASSASGGTHVLRARATDFAGNVSLSEPVTVTVPTEVAHLGLVAAWGFEEGSGDTVHDATGAGHDATLTGQTRLQGKFGQALQFGQGYLTVQSSEFIELSDRMTLSAWVLPDVPLDENPLVLEKYADWSPSYRLAPGSWWGANVSFRNFEWDWFTAEEHGAEAGPRVWTHVAGTFDGEVLKLYLNGQVVAEQEGYGPFLPGSEALLIGGSEDPGTLFPGRLDEIRIYDRALSQTEIQTDMATPVTAGALPDTTPPAVSVTAPVSGSSVSGSVQIQASASDATGVASVRFFLDGAQLGELDEAPPYTSLWHASSAPAGEHVIVAEATDIEGNSQLSAPVTVTVPAGSSHVGLIAAWGFDEGQGLATYDATGAGHDAVLVGQTWVGGKFGSALQFGDSHLSVESSQFLELSEQMTLSAWVMPDVPLEGNELALQKYANGSPAYFLSPGSWWAASAGFRSASYDWFIAEQAWVKAQPQVWTHVAGTFDGEMVRLYLDGELIDEREAAGPILTGPNLLMIGGSEDEDSAFPGRLDEIRIYDRALSQSELQADMATPVTPGALPDTTPPTVALTSPVAGPAGGLVTLSAEASDPGGIKSVRFLVDGAAFADPLVVAPYTELWHANSATPGEHQIVAEATDIEGNVALAPPVIVSVSESDSVPGLVLALGFDEGQGTVTYDASGAGHDATLSGQTWTTGKYGSALDFNGSLLAVPGSDFLNLTTEATLSAWVLVHPDTLEWSTLLAKHDDDDYSYLFYSGSRQRSPELYLNPEGWLTGPESPAFGTWTHLATTYDGVALKLYQNGEVAAETTVEEGSLRRADGPLYVGGNLLWTDETFRGRIDELRVYRRALSPAEILADMATPITEGATADTTPPVVSITAPAPGTVASGMVALAAEAADPSGILSVTFLLDGVPIGVPDTEAPYAKNWHAASAPPGSHTLQASAVDGAGNVALSPSVTVTVEQGGSSGLGLVAAYAFDEGEGEDVHDSTGAGHDTTLAGQTWVAGKYGSALEFSGNFLTVESSELIELRDEMTLSAWVLPARRFDDWALIAEKWASDWQESYVFLAGSPWERSAVAIQSDTFQWFDVYSERFGPQPGTWTHVATTYDGSTLRLYLDGEPAGERSAAGPILPGPYPLFIGGNDKGYGLFPGRIDELRVYNRALGPSEIAEDMATPITEGAETDTTPPSVSIVEPSDGSSVVGLVAVSADASDDSGIRSVRFFVDGVPFGFEDSEAPWTTAWLAAAATAGTHTLQAEATDGAGNVQLSEPVGVVVEAGTSTPGLVLALGFDEGEGTETRDATAAGHSATLSGQTWARGKFGSALEFDGELLEVPHSDLLNLTTAMTLSAWVLPRAELPEYSTVLMKQSNSEFSYLLFAKDDGGPPGAYLSGSEMGRVTENEPVPQNRWTHLAVTYSGSELILYRNGVLAGVSVFPNGPIQSVGGPLTIGGHTLWPPEIFLGRIDEVRIYNRALSQAEIEDVMATPVTPGAAADATAPAVSMTAPAAGASVSGFVQVAATATDADGVGSVEFEVDGQAVGAPVLESPYRRFWSSDLAGTGSHAIVARATDFSGNVTTSSPVSVSVVAGSPAASLAAAFGFDEGSGTTVFDASGRGHDTTLAGQAWVEGKHGTALAFSGDALTVADSDFLDLTTRMTLSAWVMPTGPFVGWPTVIMKEADSALVYVLYASSPDDLPAAWLTPVSGQEFGVYGASEVAQNVWTHLAATYDGSEFKLYANGELAGTSAVDVPVQITSNPLRIGANHVWWNEQFIGRIDDVRIYARALSAAEIQADMLRPVGAPEGPDTTPPEVALTSPAAGSSVYGSVLLHAEATDASGIASVRFFVNGAALGSPDTEAPFEAFWTAASFTPGSYTLRAEATDGAGNSATSANVSVTLTTCNPAAVSDGNPCTADTCDGETPVFTPVPAGTSCSNGNVCDGAEVCNATGVCLPGTVPTADATCDGVDDDCNGQIDEDFSGTPTSCGVGACARNATTICQNGSVVDGCVPGTPAANDASCNDVDDDCNGEKDEDYAPVATSCGVGACVAAGVTSCVNGAVGNSCVPGAPAANDASCNSVDDDCNGEKDEDYAPVATSCGVGACAATGVTSCVAGVLGNSCAPWSPSANDATCDGVDDDCDGQKDEDYAPVATNCGQGACASTGVTACTNGTLSNSCSPGSPAASDASCNGVDDDCNGQTDEDFVSTPTTCGASACAATGATSCVSGSVLDSCSPGSPAGQDTTCDGIDNDCDGLIDEGYVAVPTTCGVGACASTGTRACIGGVEQDSCAPGVPAADDATCNGIDDDCSGQTDEDYAASATSCGVGACAATGVTSCVNGSVTNSCAPGSPAANDATCNGIDDDCSGQADEDYAASATSCGVGACAATGVTSCVNGSVTNSCAPGTPASDDATCNGVDDDCSGQADEDYAASATSCGVGACAATGVTSCVNGSVTNSCAPGSPAGDDATCDGFDDDCNGQTDEDYAPVTTACGTTACAATGATSCVNGAVVDSCVPGTPAADDATCDGIDNDCDGTVDDGFIPSNTSCGLGACSATGVTSCAGGSVTNSCTPGTAAASDATCNGIDDDCSGQIDEDYAPVATSCGAGACAASGATSCVNGAVQNSCVPGTPAASDATCNGVDDDCSGQADEDYAPVATSCGIGACASTGTTRCVNGAVQDSCAPSTPAASDATCNGVDDDCSGQADEDYAPVATSCGTGACASTGTTSCVNGAVQNSCTPGTPAASDATCNGVDDDCSGQPDEDYVSQPTTCGSSSCTSSGATSCVGGALVDSCEPGTPAANDVTCDGIDNDCDEEIDEGYVPVATSCGVGACAAAGITACVDGAVQNGCTPGSPAASDATCNGIDDDCDGQTDEDYAPVATSCGVGACAATGATSCVNGSLVNGCTPGSPAASDATCDGFDDDCDGTTDEDYNPVATTCGTAVCASTGVTSCANGAVTDSCTPGTPAAEDATCDGIDNDCDGQKDEGYVPVATSCGVGACASAGVTSCANGAVTDSCTPGTPAASDSSCNGVDDDCNGEQDEDYVATTTSCGVGACVRSGSTACVNGSVTNSCASGTPAASDSSCDDLDDDCDGAPDDDYVDQLTACGAGVCAATGLLSCEAGELVNSCAPGSPQSANDATCDGIDQDCSGEADEDYPSTPTTCGVGACARTGSLGCNNGTVGDSCTPGSAAANDAICNGSDDDCDGQTDEDFVASCSGTQAQRCQAGQATTTDCSDGSVCTGSETCTGAGVCQAGTAPTVDDGNACTSDSCDPVSGVQHTPVASGVTCGTGRICDGQGACVLEFEPPVIDTQPVAASVAAGAPFSFSVVASGVNLSYQWQRFGAPIAGATSATYSAPAAEFTDNDAVYRVVVTNPGGSVTSQDAKLTVLDASLPVISLDGPNQLQTALDSHVVRGTVSDSGSGIDRMFLTSDRYAGQDFAVAVGVTGAFQAEIPLRSGQNQLLVVALDRAGNRAEQNLSVNFVLASVPTIRIESPSAGAVVTTETISVTGTVSSTLAPDDIRLKLGSSVTFPTGTGGEYSFVFEGVRLAAGMNTLTVTAETLAGTATAQTTVVYQTNTGGPAATPPRISVSNLQPDAFVSSATLPVSGRVEADSCVQSVTVNGQSAIVTGSGKSVTFDSVQTITATDGSPFEIDVMARDCASNEAHLKFFVRYDNVAPELTIEALSPEPSVNAVTRSPLKLRGVLTERNPASLMVRNQSLGVAPGTAPDSYVFEFEVALVRNEDSRIEVVARDYAGNLATAAVIVRLDSTVAIELLSPENGAQYFSTEGGVSIDVTARVDGLAPTDRVTARVDSGAAVVLGRSGELAFGNLLTSGQPAEHDVIVEVTSEGGSALASTTARVAVVDPAAVPLAVTSRSPENAAVNVETNEPVTLHFNRPVDPARLSIALFETAHGRGYKAPAAGADITTLSVVEQEEINRDRAAVVGGLSFLPGNRDVVFYPTREYAYAGQVAVEVRYDGADLERFAFSTRPLPTLAYGFVTSIGVAPLAGVEVSLRELGVTTTTDESGYYSFGFGRFLDAIPGGRYTLVVNGGWRDRTLAGYETWVNLPAGDLTSIRLTRLVRMSAHQPIVPIESGQANVILASGALRLDLGDTRVSFSDGRDAGEVQAELVRYRDTAHESVRNATPTFGYVVQPSGTLLDGLSHVSIALPEFDASYDYIDALPDWALLIGLDPRSLTLVPAGVGRIDKQARRVESRGELPLQRLDFVGVVLSAPEQATLEAYANGEVTLPALVARVVGGTQ